MNEAMIERLVSLKENFTGQDFQWIKTADTALLGKVVKCRDIQPTSNGRFMAYFEDGSQVDAAQINNKLMMLHGGTQPLSKSELSALNVKTPSRTEPSANPDIVVDPNQVAGKAKPNQIASKSVPEEPHTDMFAMFNTEETTLVLNLKIKMPDKKLLKMMYNGAEDKKDFIDQLSSYVNSQINKDTIKDSLLKTLEPPKKVIKAKPKGEIKVTEIKDENN